VNKITIRFDGGCRPTNPGNKYGSFEVALNGRQIILVSRQEFGWGTNNEAEYDALEHALRWTCEHLLTAGNSPTQFDLEAFTDSMIVLSRMKHQASRPKKNGKEAQIRMAACAGRCLGYTTRFASFKIHWNGRQNNVSTFGH
jgi:ribonuclease HI